MFSRLSRSSISTFSRVTPINQYIFIRHFSVSTLPAGVINSFDKIRSSPDEALDKAGIKSGQMLVVGGFGVCGIPATLLEAVENRKDHVKDLTLVSNNAGWNTDKVNLGIAPLLTNRQVKRMISSYVGENAAFATQYLKGELELVFTPQGTLAEQLRAGGAGIPAFFTRTGYGTAVADGGFGIKLNADGSIAIPSPKKEIRTFKGREYVMEESIFGDIALVKAWKADPFGNLVWKGTARSFNPDCATASRHTIVEVDEIVPLGSLKPDEIHLPGIYVKGIILSKHPKVIERPMFSDTDAKAPTNAHSKEDQKRERIARRAALELKHGMNVNLGIGMPTLCSNYIPKGVNIMFQSENGLLGMGPYPKHGQEDPDLVNAGKESVTTVTGASIFSSSQSFAMIRGRHVDITILGAMEISQYGDLANWMIPRKLVKGMGGAMDLVSSGSRVVVVTEHVNAKGGGKKILNACKLPLTGPRCVNRIITDMAVFDVDFDNGLTLVEIAHDTNLEAVRAATECTFKVCENLKTMQASTA